jgi:protein-disulfide isomerase
LKQIEREYGDRVRIAFKHLPLPFHQNAQIAAEASMAAHEQGKFWQMYDKLFENQAALDRTSLLRHARDLGLDVERFAAALNSGKYREYVRNDAEQASRADINGTPTFVINGRVVRGVRPLDTFKRVIDEELATTSD